MALSALAPRIPVRVPSKSQILEIVRRAQNAPEVDSALTCADHPRPRFEPRVAELICFNATEPEWYPHLNAHKVRLDFYLESEESAISAFFHLGRGEEAEVKRGSKFYAAWVKATGRKPSKGEGMPPQVFIGKQMLIEVRDAFAKSNGDAYSVAEIVVQGVRGCRARNQGSAKALGGSGKQTR